VRCCTSQLAAPRLHPHPETLHGAVAAVPLEQPRPAGSAWDIERGCLRLPGCKTGAKVVPPAAAAVKLLSELPHRGAFVLPAATGVGHYTGLQKEPVRARAGLAGVQAHDLRHSFASFAVVDGNSLYLIGKLLGHKQARSTEVYPHLAEDPIRAVADRTATRIVAAMTPTASAT
jgi:integrase